MYEVVKEFLERLGTTEDGLIEFSEGDKRLAVAVLLYRMVTIDGQVRQSEMVRFRQILAEFLDVSAVEMRRFEQAVRAESSREQSLFPFTVIASKMPLETRQRILELMQEISMSDKELHEFEINLMERTAELLDIEFKD